MKKPAMNKGIYILVFTLLSIKTIGQDCLNKLENAQKAYLNGDLRSSISLLEPCLNGQKLETGDKETALRLLINSLLVLNEDSLANVYMKMLLEENPLSEIRANDLAQYKKLHGSFEIIPTRNVGLIVGINSSVFSTLQYRSIGSISEENDTYASKPGVTLGFKIDQYLTKNIFISTAASYSRYSYNHRELILTYQQSFIEERLDYLSIPLQIGLEYAFDNIDVFASAGVATNFLLSSKADLELFGIESPDAITVVPGIPEKVQGIDLSHQRKGVIFNYLLNLGVRRRIGLYGIEISAQYDIGANNLVDEAGRFSEQEVWETYSYVPNDFKLDAIKFLVGFSRRFSVPVKIPSQ